MELLSNTNVFIINQIHVDVLSQMKNKYKKKKKNHDISLCSPIITIVQGNSN